MKNLVKTSALVAVLAFNTSADAQILGKLKDAAGKIDNAARTVKKAARTVDGVAGTNVSNSVPGSVESAVGGGSDYFSDNSITFSKTRGGAAEKNFTVNDNLYAKITLKKPLIEFLKEEGRENEPFIMVPVSLIYIIKGAARGEYSSVKVPKEDYGKTTLILDLLPAKGDSKSQYLMGGQYQSGMARPLSAFDSESAVAPNFGSQRFDFTFGFNEEYHGAFNFTVKNKAEQKMMAARAESAQTDMSDNIAMDTPIPAEFSTQGKFADPQLSLANIKSMLSGEGFTLMKVVIDARKGPDYNIQKNALDIPEYKITGKPVWVIWKDKNGKCFYTREYFTRQYEGGGKYGALDQAATTAGNTQIDCNKVK